MRHAWAWRAIAAHNSKLEAAQMRETTWRVEAYRSMDVYVRTALRRQAETASQARESQGGLWGYEARVCQQGADPSDAGDTEVISSGSSGFATRHAAEVAAFAAAYGLVDRMLGQPE